MYPIETWIVKKRCWFTTLERHYCKQRTQIIKKKEPGSGMRVAHRTIRNKAKIERVRA